MGKSRKKQVMEEDAFSVSIGDLMAGILSVFILVLCYYAMEYNKATSQYTSGKAIRAEFIETIATDYKKATGFELEIKADEGLVILPENLLFERSSYEIKDERGKKALRQLTDIIWDKLKDPRYTSIIDTVFIEGHTDSAQYTNGVFDNWKLSAFRAIGTWDEMRAHNKELNKTKNNRGESLFSFIVYADTRKTDKVDDKGVHDDGADRRINIRFTVTPPEKK